MALEMDLVVLVVFQSGFWWPWVEPGVGGWSKDGLWIFWEEKIHWWCGKNREIEYSDGSDGWKGCCSKNGHWLGLGWICVTEMVPAGC